MPCVPSQPSTVRMPFSLLLLLLLILRALLVVATSAVAFATLATAMCRGAPGALILAHARTRLLSRQVQLGRVQQLRDVLRATLGAERLPQPGYEFVQAGAALLLAQEEDWPAFGSLAPRAFLLLDRRERLIAHADEPTTDAAELGPFAVLCRTAPIGPPPPPQASASVESAPAAADGATVSAAGLLRASVARNVQYCCYVACMIVLERSYSDSLYHVISVRASAHAEVVFPAFMPSMVAI